MIKDRQKHAAALAQAMQTVEQNPGGAVQVLRNLLIDTLSDTQRETLAWMTTAGEVDSARLAREWEISLVYASMILNDLWQLGLAARQEQRSGSTRVYLYSIRAEKESERVQSN